MAVTYGVNVYQGETRGQPPLQVESEIPAIFGAFPCDNESSPSMGYPNEWKEVTSWADFKDKYGFEEQWGSGLLERSDGWNASKSVYRIMSGFGLYPVLIYNVLDPATHQTSVTDENVTFAAGSGVTQDLAGDYILHDTIVVQDDGDAITYVLDTDYSIERVSGVTQITRITTGSIGETDTVHVDYDYCDPSGITDAQVTAAIEAADDIITSVGFSKLPGTLHAPYWSMVDIDSITAANTRAQLAAKAAQLNTVFTTRFVYDLDDTAYAVSGDLQDVYDDKDVLSENGRCFFPAGTTSSTTEELLSDWHIGTLAAKVFLNGFPGISASNNVLSGFIPDHLLRFPDESNAVRGQGIVTVCLDPGDRGWVEWGTWTSYYNGTATDLGLDSQNQNDVINYLNKLITRDVWVKNCDKPLNKQRLQDFVEKWNTLGKQQVSKGTMVGWELAFLEEDNPDITSAVKFRLYLLAPEPQKRTDVEINVDLSYLDTLFG